MNKYRILFVLILFFALVINAVSSRAAQPDPYLDFARSLFQEEDYYRAITEARRFLFLRPHDPRRVEAYLLLGRSYFQLKQFHEAKAAFSRVVRQEKRPDLAAEAV
ncbi:MAG TPA: tetratricopeptide repeat protein, partial [Desulfobacteraceae bacterium]|nr:tetratricopeptide repeat protein [Desulfobacteraceae bacterium]